MQSPQMFPIFRNDVVLRINMAIKNRWNIHISVTFYLKIIKMRKKVSEVAKAPRIRQSMKTKKVIWNFVSYWKSHSKFMKPSITINRKVMKALNIEHQISTRLDQVISIISHFVSRKKIPLLLAFLYDLNL